MTETIALINAVVAALLAGGGVYLWRAQKREKLAGAKQSEATAIDHIAEAARNLVAPLNARIDQLEATNSRLEREVAELRLKVEQYIRDEVAYQAELHSKNVEIRVLRAELDEARSERDELKGRVVHLEEVVRRHGLNGD